MLRILWCFGSWPSVSSHDAVEGLHGVVLESCLLSAEPAVVGVCSAIWAWRCGVCGVVHPALNASCVVASASGFAAMVVVFHFVFPRFWAVRSELSPYGLGPNVLLWLGSFPDHPLLLS